MGAKDCNHRPIGTFNPACCLRPPAAKQITYRRNDESSNSSSSSSSSSVFSSSSSSANSSSNDKPKKIHCRSGSLRVDPSSPRVSCMGQIKRGKQGASSNGSPPTINNKFLKLKRIFSGKNMAMVTASPRSTSSQAGDIDSSVNIDKVIKIGVVVLADMDPPLPVTKRVARDSNYSSVSLWKRRCGQGLEALQIHQLQQKQQQQLCLAV